MPDPLHDPRFPHRPDSPEFWKLCDVALKYDGRMQEAPTQDAKQQAFEESIAETISPEDLSYFALQRAMKLTKDPQLLSMLASIYMEAFVVGVQFERR